MTSTSILEKFTPERKSLFPELDFEYVMGLMEQLSLKDCVNRGIWAC